MKVWIDKATGTWGTNVEDIVIVDLDMAGQHMDPEGDEYTALATLEDGGDSTIIGVAEHALEYNYGRTV